MTHQEKSNEKSVEVDDNEKPEDITKPENEKADSSVVLRETTSTASEVWEVVLCRINQNSDILFFLINI